MHQFWSIIQDNEALDSNVTYTQLLDDYNLFVESGADCSLLRADSDVIHLFHICDGVMEAVKIDAVVHR